MMVAVAIGVGVAGAVGAVGNVVAGSEAASGAKQAASTESQAQLQALQIEQQQGNAAAQLQVPYEQFGTTAATELTGEMQGTIPVPGQAGPLGAPAPLDQASIAAMPGYQFALQQGLLSTQNAQAAQGLGVSGNALAAASNYAVGLANTNFQNYFSDYWANQNNRYQMLYNNTQLGANAATNAGNQMVQVGGNIGNMLTTSAANIGSAQAAAGADLAQGTSSAAQAPLNTINTISSNPLLANALLGQTQGGSTIGREPSPTYNNMTNVPSAGPWGSAT